ncbi:MAG TPA: nucleoside deaminase [Ginsengibacter sp.]|nr:nucleoside deaminase [Ginsengibacter sp.]HRP18218.1 nucleoside deaminase [Ginsengibacter sp.]
MNSTHEDFMKQALREAMKAYEADEVPVGAVVVIENRIIGRGYNQVEMLNDSTAHAEIIALTAAFNYLGAKYLPDATLYVTVEPCTMCCGALYWSKIGTVVYGASDPKHGGLSLHGKLLHPRTSVTAGVMEEDCAKLMKEFFAAKRK